MTCKIFIPERNNIQPAKQSSRRQFVSCLGSAIAVAAAQPVFAMNGVTSENQLRTLEFHHLHTGETLKTTYWNGQDYDDGALQSINYILRDFRTQDVYPIERQLLDILCKVQAELNVKAPFEVIGGYRSPQTNQMLRKRSTGVAKKSLHMQGRAIDVRLPDVNSARLREVAADLHLGGVGYYRSSNFVHLDTGRPRVW